MTARLPQAVRRQLLTGMLLGVLASSGALTPGTNATGSESTARTHPPPAMEPASDPGDSAWSWPVEPPIRISGAYRAPATRYSAGHRGIDIRAREGASVFAPASGIVHFAGFVVDRPVVSIDHGEVLSSFEAIHPAVEKGERVERGELIGTVAPGGHCAGRCLHLGARIDGEYVSPLLLLGGIPRAVLLPAG